MSSPLNDDLDSSTTESPHEYADLYAKKLQEMEDLGIDNETIQKAAKVFAPELGGMYKKKLQEMEDLGIDQETINMARKEFERISSYVPEKKRKTMWDTRETSQKCQYDSSTKSAESNSGHRSCRLFEIGSHSNSNDESCSMEENASSSSDSCYEGFELGDDDSSSAEPSDISVELNDDHSSSSESSDISENLTDGNSYELDEDEIKCYKSTLNPRKRFMSMQGFKSSALFSAPAEQTEPEGTLLEDLTSLEHNGKTYHKGSVYEYCHRTRRSPIVLIGIISFVEKDLVKCVEIAPFEDTFLGVVTKETQNKDLLDFNLSDFPKYVQVVVNYGCYLTLPLSRFREKSQELKSIPQMVYEAQTDEDHWEAFAYYCSNGNVGNTINRCGRRFSSPTVIEYFAGAGGSHEAYKAKGFKTHQLVEKDDTAVKSLAANNNQDRDKIFHGCVENALDLQVELSDVCHFSSPCCGFSLANRNGSVNDRANNDLSLLFVKMLHLKKPKIGCFENVMGMWRRKNVHYLLNIIAGTLNAEYQVRCSKLNTAHYGDPQSRNRLFLLASKNGMLLPNIPRKRYGEGLLPLVTVGHVMRKVGGERTSNFQAFDALSEQQNRLDPLKPSPTIKAQGRQPMHPFEDRRINEVDMLMLMSLSPKNFVLKGSRKERRRQVGNMIPFKTMCAIVEEMISVLEFEYDGLG